MKIAAGGLIPPLFFVLTVIRGAISGHGGS
jgi:hypothetical protein